MLNLKSAFILALFTSMAAHSADLEQLPVQVVDAEGLDAIISAELQSSNDELLLQIRAENLDTHHLADKEIDEAQNTTHAE